MNHDAIVLLTGGLAEDGPPPPAAGRRALHAARLYRRGLAPHVVVSGRRGLTVPEPVRRTEAAAMADVLRDAGVPGDAILTEERSVDTFGNAYFTHRTVLAPMGWTRIVLVTSEFHIPRATYLFRKVCGPAVEVLASPADSGLSVEDLAVAWNAEFGIFQMFREWLDDVESGDTDAIQRVFENHGGYQDGDVDYDIPTLQDKLLTFRLSDPLERALQNPSFPK